MFLKVAGAASPCSVQKGKGQAAPPTFQPALPQRVFLTEGETDAISLLDWGDFEVPGQSTVLALPCASAWDDAWRLLLTGREVLVMTDEDAAGHAAARRVFEKLRGHAARLAHLSLRELLIHRPNNHHTINPKPAAERGHSCPQ